MGRVRTVEWVTRDGRRRVIRLYRSYQRMVQRLRGTRCSGGGRAVWQGLPNGFASWTEFRAYVLALDPPYSRERNSLDRIKPELGYQQGNLQWLTVAENSAKANRDRFEANRAAFLDETDYVLSNEESYAATADCPF